MQLNHIAVKTLVGVIGWIMPRPKYLCPNPEKVCLLPSMVKGFCRRDSVKNMEMGKPLVSWLLSICTSIPFCSLFLGGSEGLSFPPAFFGYPSVFTGAGLADNLADSLWGSSFITSVVELTSSLGILAARRAQARGLRDVACKSLCETGPPGVLCPSQGSLEERDRRIRVSRRSCADQGDQHERWRGLWKVKMARKWFPPGSLRRNPELRVPSDIRNSERMNLHHIRPRLCGNLLQ